MRLLPCGPLCTLFGSIAKCNEPFASPGRPTNSHPNHCLYLYPTVLSCQAPMTHKGLLGRTCYATPSDLVPSVRFAPLAPGTFEQAYFQCAVPPE